MNNRSPVLLYLSYPKRKSRGWGNIILKDRGKIIFDSFALPEDDDQDIDIIFQALDHILRTTSSRSIRYLVRTMEGGQFLKLRKITEDALLRIKDLQFIYGGNTNEGELFECISRYISGNREWQDMNNELHSYVLTLGNGKESITSVINVGPRRIIFKRQWETKADPVTANFYGLRSALQGLPARAGVAVWSNVDVVNSAIRREKQLLMSETAEVAATKLIEHCRRHSLEVVSNQQANTHLMKMGILLMMDKYIRVTNKAMQVGQ